MPHNLIVKQYVVDAAGKQIGVILPIEEYQALIRLQSKPARRSRHKAGRAHEPLYGTLSHLGGVIAPTPELDEARRELWAAWDRSEAP